MQTLPLALDGLPEGRLPHAFLDQAVEVQLRAHELRLAPEPLRFGQDVAVLGDQRMPVPGQVGGGFAVASGGIQVAAEAARGLTGYQLAPVAGLADGHVRSRQVRDHRGAGERSERGRRHWHPHVLADLHVQYQPRLPLGLEEQPTPEGHSGLPAQVDVIAQRRVTGGELARLVELPIVGQEGLGCHAQNPTAMDHRAAVVERAVDLQRQSNDADERKPGRGAQYHTETVLDRFEQCFLVEQVVAGIAGKPQLREQHKHCLLGSGLLHQCHRLGGVELRIRDAERRDAHRHAHQVVAVQVEEWGGRFAIHATQYL